MFADPSKSFGAWSESSRSGIRRRAPGVPLRLETLEDRQLLACAVWQAPLGTLNIACGAAAEVVTVKDDGAGGITGSATGAGAFDFAGIGTIHVNTGGGSDTVTYRLNANLLAGQQRTVHVNLGAGQDRFTADFFNAAFGIGSDLLAGSRLSISVDGGAGGDTMAVNADRDVDVAANARLDLMLNGGADGDRIAVRYRGELDGVLKVEAEGGSGNDRADVRLSADPGSSGSLFARNRGGDAADNLRLDVFAPPGLAVDAVLDGGAGVDVWATAGPVVVMNCP